MAVFQVFMRYWQVNKKLIRMVEQFLIMGGLQVFVMNYLRMAIVPSFFLIWLLILAWEGDREIALMLSFFTGILYDVISRGIPGVSSFIFLVIIYINCLFRPVSLPGRFAGAFIFSLCYFLMLLFGQQKGFLWSTYALLKYSALFAFYNAVILFVIEVGMRKLRWKEKKQYLSI